MAEPKDLSTKLNEESEMLAVIQNIIVDTARDYMAEKISAIRARRNQLSPIYRLPNATLSIIFKLADSYEPKSRPSSALSLRTPVALSRVSSRWREIAFTTSSLWTTINVPNLRTLSLDGIYQPIASSIYFGLSMLCLIDISFSDEFTANRFICAITTASSRLQEIVLDGLLLSDSDAPGWTSPPEGPPNASDSPLNTPSPRCLDFSSHLPNIPSIYELQVDLNAEDGCRRIIGLLGRTDALKLEITGGDRPRRTRRICRQLASMLPLTSVEELGIGPSPSAAVSDIGALLTGFPLVASLLLASAPAEIVKLLLVTSTMHLCPRLGMLFIMHSPISEANLIELAQSRTRSERSDEIQCDTRISP
ncbi:hypothetical protein BOTBODRAFT_178577 [Botryobasidium botryosum FD-172 SS1]|uniref:F-box domain-containing protein n=1 Tax=Botryobasidium botryosum (strain FD-172 SS1) TaxID=930990 RepID=A0A067M389_BOTB1|nr:hypothetical protein BOTBODRAFT_178577 [Botryobasidium botryosum FD-172 SS1]